MVETIENTNQDKFTFHYYGYPGCLPGYPHGKVGTCPIEIKKENGKTTVIVTEPEEMATTSVTNRFESIATKLYYYCLRNERPESITWMQHDIKDLAGRESICEVSLTWNGKQYVDPRWDKRRPVTIH